MNRSVRSQSGIALLVVLWVLVLFSAVAVSYAYGLRSEARMTRNQLEHARAEALAEAGVARALQVLGAAGRPVDRYGRPERLTLDGGDVEWVVQNAAGMFNLNTATAAELHEFFARFGAGAESAEALGDAVIDWRDADNLRHAAGAEDGDYRTTGLAHGAADAPFGHRAELLQVLGMDPGLFAALAPHLTVHGSHRGINPRYASREMLLKLGAGTEQEIDEFLRSRQLAPTLARLPLPSSGLFGSGESRYAAIHVSARTSSGVRVQLRVLADIGNTADGVEPVDWQYAWTAPEVPNAQ